jgi:hypothetical protein
MKIMKALSIVLALSLAAGPLGAEEATTKEATGEENAALSYWQAFALLPKLTDSENRAMKNFDTAPLDETAVRIIEKSEPALKMLLQGAKSRRCDWGWKKENGVQAFMPHLNKAREVVRLACLRARYHLSQNNPPAAIDDLMAALTLGRHIGQDGPLISGLVYISIESLVVSTTAEHLTRLDRPTLKMLSERFKTAPAAPTLGDALRVEKELVQTSPQPPQLQAMYKQSEKTYDQLIEMADLPPDKFEKRALAIQDPLLGPALKSFARVGFTYAGARTKMAMLRGAIEALKDGNKEKLKSIKDPYGDKPFKYREIGKGFELEGTIQVHGKPVTLAFGTGKGRDK